MDVAADCAPAPGPCAPSPAFALELADILQRRPREPAFQEGLRAWQARFRARCAKPTLRMVAWVATRRCNLHCRYCVLPREEAHGPDLDTREVQRIFADLAADLDPAGIAVGITGGEATLREDLVDLVRYLHGLGFGVAVDSNGLAYGRDPDLFDRLVEAGMRGPTISIDGVGAGQRVLRGDATEGTLTWRAIERVCARHPDLGTTAICAVAPGNLAEVPAVFRRLEDLGIDFARVSPVFPLGRAGGDPSTVLGGPALRDLLGWIAEQRTLFAQGRRDLEIELIDDGWCGLAWEGGLLRASFFHCEAGISTLGLEHDGRVLGCPVVRGAFNLQGDARTERLATLWRDRFRRFRDRAWLRQGDCARCGEWEACLGGSLHNHDDDGRPRRCTAMTLQAT